MALTVTATDDNVDDVTQFAALPRHGPHRSSIAEVYADKGYYSFENYRLVEKVNGAVPFIDFPENARPVGDGGPNDRAPARYKSKLARDEPCRSATLRRAGPD